MDAELADHVRAAAAAARRHALAFRAPVDKDALPWSVIEAFDAKVRGHVERDRRIEEERDRVLIAAVNLAETPGEEGEGAVAAAAAGHGCGEAGASPRRGEEDSDVLGDGAPPEWALLLVGCLLGLATGICVAAFNRGVSAEISPCGESRCFLRNNLYHLFIF